MRSDNQSKEHSPEAINPKLSNAGEPIRLQGLNYHGFAAESVMEGGEVQIITCAAMTSTDSFFHRVAPNIVSSIEFAANQAGQTIDLRKIQNILLVIRQDDSAELWLDTAAVTIEATVKKSFQAMSVVFEDDLADITGLWFPHVKIEPEDRILYLFREGFRFGLAFDLRADHPLDIPGLKKTFAALHRRMRYADVYSMIATNSTFQRMIQAGWFPFAEIMTSEFKALSGLIESGSSLSSAENNLIDKFTEERLKKMFERWIAKPYFATKREILWPGIQAFVRKEPVVTLKLLLTEIEGILHAIYQDETGNSTRNRSKLQKHLIERAIKRAGGEDTLFFPTGFMHYLNDYTFASSEVRNASRHAVSHGRADASDYTQARALQAILTLDQIAFYC